ncbi:MAG: hypothetical protein P8080_01995 [Gammaproteobacteria bacterium]
MKLRTAVVALLAGLLAATSTTAMAQGQTRQGDRGEQANRERQLERDLGRDRSVQHDRLQTRDRSSVRAEARDQQPAQGGDGDQNQVRKQDRYQTGQPEYPMGVADADIYGHQMMTAQERNQYREQLENASEEEKLRLKAQHREQMQMRAKEEGIDLDVPGDE